MFIEDALCFNCYSRPTPTFAGYLSFTRYEWQNQKVPDQPVPDHSDGSEDFFKTKFGGFTIDFKGNKWLLWSRCLELDKKKLPEVWKNPLGREQQILHVNYLQAHVNFCPLRAETAGNRYRRRFLPASAGIFTCGSVYLRPSQVILHAPVLQCCSRNLVEMCWEWISASFFLEVLSVFVVFATFCIASHQSIISYQNLQENSNLTVGAGLSLPIRSPMIANTWVFVWYLFRLHAFVLSVLMQLSAVSQWVILSCLSFR